jgi:tetratricopeptide (TPR) repeat protein
MEAERRVAEARSALQANNFEIARERLDRARERYLTSLSFEQDAALRANSDRLLNELASAIIKAQNELVIADTRRLLNEGKSQYLQGQFDRAESALLQARSRWNTTNATPEVEVEYWLKLVQTALSVKSGRDIPITAPLYPEMSQLISLAKGYYEEGASLEGQARPIGALNQFDAGQAEDSRHQGNLPAQSGGARARAAHRPAYRRDAFNRQFARMVEEARVKITTNSDLTTAYSDLKDLEAINPRYAGLRALIEQAEIKLGFRQPPPDPRAIARARELVAAAQRIFDSGDTSRFPLARTQLEEAILLDPNNESASRLKDRIATIIGGTQTIVLSAAAEALYNEAVSAFSRADYITARARLARLSASFAQAGRVQKVLDLDARLSAVGY